MKKILLLLLLNNIIFGQKDGFWDKDRAFTKEIKLASGNRTLIKIDELPEGASEFVFRILLIDENNKISSSLASILKAVPDPTGISQGTAGAIVLSNSLSGDDTCVYGIYTNEKTGNQFLKDGNLSKACHFITEPVSKDSKVISIKNSKCFENAPNIWFAFENKNWVMSTKIVLEVVSWIDYKASRGWNIQTKKELLKEIENLSLINKLANKSDFFANFLNNFTSKYKHSEYKQLLDIEKTKAFEIVTEESLKQSGEMQNYINSIRKTAFDLFLANKPTEAIELINKQIIEKKHANDVDFSALGDIYLYTKQFVKAEEQYKKAIKLNGTELLYKLKLAHVLLFSNQLKEAKEIHNLYKNNNIKADKSWFDQTKFDFDDFEKKGFPNNNFKKILRLLD